MTGENNEENEEGGEDMGMKEQSSFKKTLWPLRTIETSRATLSCEGSMEMEEEEHDSLWEGRLVEERDELDDEEETIGSVT